MRDKIWLENKFNNIWQKNFPEVEKKNDIRIMFKGKSKNRFGCIKKNPDKSTTIIINSLFAHERVPEWIIKLTLAHELIHYMHGFNSPHQRLFKHPHLGGIVNRELKERGYGDFLKKERAWFNDEWLDMYKDIKKEVIEFEQ